MMAFRQTLSLSAEEYEMGFTDVFLKINTEL
jgi:hypothetical protein